MAFKWGVAFQGFLFLVLSSALYFLFIINIPLFYENHGLLALNEWADLSMAVWVKGLILFSALLVTTLGTLMVEWIPNISPGVIGNLWALSYFFLWVDTATALYQESHSLSFLAVLGLGFVWVRLYFHGLEIFGFGLNENPKDKRSAPSWIIQSVWGWMGFYFGLSCLLLFQSFRFMGQRAPLAFGAYFLCFLNYLLVLQVRKLSGDPIDRF